KLTNGSDRQTAQPQLTLKSISAAAPPHSERAEHRCHVICCLRCKVMSPKLEQIIEAIQQLLPSEQEEFLRWLKERDLTVNKKASEAELEAEVDRMLLARGHIQELPVGLTDEEDDFEPIEIEGEPLSETIIRERR